jgi:2'-5' RNA ligase
LQGGKPFVRPFFKIRVLRLLNLERDFLSTLRLFIAVNLPQSICQGLAGLGRQMEAFGLGLRWVKPNAMHLTLRFLGCVEEDCLPAIKGAMDKAAFGREAFWLEARGLGAFPGAGNARVVWAGVHGGVEALKGLAASLDDALEQAGFARENRPFKAHLTIGRAKARPNPRALAEAIAKLGHYCLPPFLVDEAILYQSELKPSGPVYTALHRAKLKTASELLEAQK